MRLKMFMRGFLLLMVFVLPVTVFASLVQITSPSGSLDVMGGEFRVYNNVWGASTPQTIEVETTSSYFKVLSTGHNQSGGPPAAYPFILKGRHFGGAATTKNNPLPIRVSNVTSAPTTWTISGTGAAGIWNCAYDNWFVEGTTNRLEMMIWINYKGGCQPAGTKRATASINGYSWDVWYNGSGVLSYKIVNVQTSVSLDIKNFINDAVSRGWLNTAWDFGAFEAGFEIWTNGSGLTSNSFSATAYSGTVPSPTATRTATPTATATPSAGATPTVTPGSSNLALGKNATASTVEKAGCETAKAVDGNTTTRWSSQQGVDPQWIYVDLGAVYSINKVVLNWEQAYGKSYQIQVSNDATNWTNVYSTTTGDGGIDSINFTATNGRYVRMYGTVRGTTYGYSLWEFEVYGGGGGGTQVIPVENGTLAGGAVLYNSPNAENGQYVGYMHLVGASDTVSGVDGGSGGSKTLTIRYATSDTNPTLDLYVNGAFIRTLTFTSTGGWETFNSTSTSVTLNSGTGNTIMLKHNSSNSGGANLDTFRIQ